MIRQNPRFRSRNDFIHKILQSLNLRPEEGERTLFLFSIYTATSVGLLWLEQTSVALFLTPPPDGFGAKWLPVIYIASAFMGSALGVFYSWIQNRWPLPKVLLTVIWLMAVPVFLLRFGLESHQFNGLIALGTVFLLRLWMDAFDILNDLNAQVTANQLFNIREIKRAYPIVSSGLLLGDVIAGFSLPVLLTVLGLNNVLIASAVMTLVGGVLLMKLTQKYPQAFPNQPVTGADSLESHYSSRSISGPVRKYIVPLFMFFVMAQILLLLVEFQYLGELESNFDTDQLAGFLGLFSGVLGLFELVTQWFVSSRAVERLGVFVVAMCLPVSLSILGLITILLDKKLLFTGLEGAQILFLSAIALRFFDELLRYTLIAGIEPFLFQPLPSELRNSVQTWVQGVAEPITVGFTGGLLLLAVNVIHRIFPQATAKELHQLQGSIFIAAIVVFSIVWAISAWKLRSSYISLLVQGAEQGRLGFSSKDLGQFKKAIVEALERQETEADKRSCIQLLERVDPEQAGEILAPLLVTFSPSLQRQSLEVMLRSPNVQFQKPVQQLLKQKQQPPLDVLALALRYLWLCDPHLDVDTLQPYLRDRLDPLIRATAANLMIQRGDPPAQEAATVILETMLTSPRERERVVAVQSLPSPDFSPLATQYLPQLLQDESARVRCALLEAIGDKRLASYYGALLRGLHYKSTREAAKKALVSLGNHSLELLKTLGEDSRKSDFIRLQAWNTIAEIQTPEAIAILVEQLTSSWGNSRKSLLRVLSKIPNDQGIEAVLEQWGSSSIEGMLDQELSLMGHLHGAALDFRSHTLGDEGALMLAALEGMKKDIFERCFLLMQFLYPASSIQAALLNLDSDSQSSIALGLELLDNTLKIPQKRLFLDLLDNGLQTALWDLGILVEVIPYHPSSPPERLRSLMELRHFLSDWSIACCFHLARVQRWSISREATLVSLRHPSGFVREGVLAYLREASPRSCLELLPLLKNDTDAIVVAQVKQIEAELRGAV